ncbi:zinc finger protein 729-like [Calliphora vicina]|uniref:zinc finger protein 729-like n=1 Tax=Calliphora vicina TaxID=7373 RepID=UPI00325A95D9
MSIKLCCCLCFSACNEYKSLQNDVGECNEIYEITVKYFDPMLITENINTKCSKDNKILCLDCWLHINGFHEFQQTVITIRSLLEEADVKPKLLEIKVEEEQITPVISEKNKDVDNSDEKLTHFEDILIKNEDALGNDVELVSNEVDDDIQMKDTKESVTEDQKPKSRRSREPKDSTKVNAKTDCDEDEEDDERKLNDADKPKNNPGNNYGLVIDKEFDEFFAKWKPLLECDICNETFPGFDLLKGHFKDIHNARCYIKCCEHKFYRRCDLVDHIRLHINPETHKCDICGKYKHNLKLHKKVVHEETEQFECDVCHRTFNEKPSLERHLLTHATGSKDFICKECGNAYVVKSQLKSHIRIVHSYNRVCDQCGKTLHSIGALKTHLMEHAGIEIPKLLCDECGAQLTSHRYLKRHKAAYHKDGTTIYVCSICGKVTGSESSLLMHKKNVHHTESRHKCTYCGKAFKHRKILRGHIAKHTGEDLYQCPHCPQTFKNSSNMRHHRKKAHPVEFEEGRKNRLQLPKVDITQVTKQVVIIVYLKMSIKLCCSLCCSPSSEYKTLHNEVGDSTEVYEITVKYFDPMLITDEEICKFPQENKVLCQDCWVPIKEFHEFQLNVIKTRSLLEKSEIKQLPLIIKTENEIELADLNVNSEVDRYFDKSDDDDDNDNFRFESIDIKTDLEEEESITTHDEDEDEKPLINWKRTNVANKKIKISPKPKNCESNAKTEPDATKPKARRGRKPKNMPAASFNNDKNDNSHENSDLDENGLKIKKVKLNEDDEKEKSNSKFNLEKARESDAFIREWKPVLECDLCEETTSSFDKLRSHFREKHKTRFYIKCCERKFYRRYVLVNHIQLHLDPETHKCEICGKVSANKNNLKLHKKLMHEEIEQLECEVCHKLFNLKTSLDRHSLTHVTGDKDFVCQECGKGYVLEVQLKSHIRTVHNVDRVCDQCGKTVHGIQALKKHLMEHAGIAKPKFPCDECGVELNSRNGLKRHKGAFHHDGSTIYVCGICGKVAASESALLNHKKYVHEEERKHKCTYCDKAFKRPKNLQEHIATHTGQDLYQCPHCPQTFKVSANMHHHRKKVHPVEWEEGRKNRLQVPKVDINSVKNQVVL